MLEQVCFGAVAVLLLGSAAKVVTSHDLVHTVLWLGVMLAATAAVFVLLSAPFLAAIQLILYTGGLLTLMLFGVMLTRRDQGFVVLPNESHRPVGSLLASAGAFALLASAALNTRLPDAAGEAVTTKELGRLFFTQHALAFEVLGLLLLAATLGAIVLARKADAGSPGEASGPSIAERKRLPHPSGRAER